MAKKGGSYASKAVKKKGREQNKQRQQRYRDNVKSHPVQYEVHKAKDRERKQKAKADGKIRSSRDRGERERRSVLLKSKMYMREYRARRKAINENEGSEKFQTFNFSDILRVN